MSFFLFLTVVQALVGAILVGVILMQRSEGGGLGVGGSPSGLMSARGAADFMTRATTILATVFVILSIALAAVSVSATTDGQVDTSLDRSVPASSDPLAPATQDPVPGTNPATGLDPLAPPAAGNDPLAGAAGE